jgi:CBS domain-containing protein
MKVEDLMTREIAVCTPEDSLRMAARIMWEKDCGCVPVVSPDDGKKRVIGMLTDRDICMTAVHQGGSLDDLRVSAAMSHGVVSCRPGDSVELAVKLLQEQQIRRLPVIGEEEQLVGLLSLADVAREARREHALLRREVSDFEVAVALEAICAPREAMVH